MASTTETSTEQHVENGPLEHLAALIPIEDLTQTAIDCRLKAQRNYYPASTSHDTLDQICRVLYREPRQHVVLTGRKGVGKTTLLHQLADITEGGQIPFLSHSRILWMDCQNVGPEDSRACLESIFAGVSRLGGLVLCLDGLNALLKKSGGGTNKPLLRALIDRPNLRLIGVMSSWEYSELISGDAEMLECFQRVEIDEPDEDTSLEILRHHARRFGHQYDLEIPDSVVQRTLALTSTFVLNECHPTKSIRVLSQVCSDVDYDRSQLRMARQALGISDIVKVISKRTGIPIQTISGENEELDFETALRDAVVGQDAAVKQVAAELRVIKSGLSEPEKPAAVFLFAGMTGVGKTELAKRIAELYSTSRRLQVYTMGNYTEPHSISGIIGVPPGYVGHEEGGRLINELNADPYSVFILDEAEKCHPNIWKPFLNLFDEGWIVDQRGVKAYADRAIIILTTNAGDKQIAQMLKSGTPDEEIIERVKQALSRVRQERSSQPVFPPQFLSRIKRILVFNPLDAEAMIGIARIGIQQMQERWLRKREKRIEVDEDLIVRLGQHACELNDKSNGREGGRIVKRLIGDLFEGRIQEASLNEKDQYAACSEIALTFAGGPAAHASAHRDGVHETSSNFLQKEKIGIHWR